MDNSPRSLLLAALLALFVAGCAAPPAMVDRLADTEPEELLAQAQEQPPEQAASSRLEAAAILARQGDESQALEVASQLDDSLLSGEERVRWALLFSRLAFEQEDATSVLEATQVLDEGIQIGRDDHNTLRYRKGLALGMVGEYQAAAAALLGVQADTERNDLNDDIWRLMSRLPPQALDELAREADLVTAGWIELVELQRQSGGDIERFLTLYANWRDRNGNHPAARRPPSEFAALRDLRGQEVRRMAILLPESGPLANVASEIRRGIQARHMEAGNGGQSTPQMVFIDASRGDLQSLYAEASMAGAQVVIGPLDKDQVTELENRDSVPIPTLALNYGYGERNHARDLFQYGLSAEDEARQVARRAYLDGHRRSAVLVPDNEWGNRVGEAFRREWQRQGGDISSSVRYNPQGAVASAVRPLLNVSGNRARLSDVDMLFLLALPSYARQVPPTLDYYYAGDLPIYATSHLFEGRPQPRVDHDLNDVMFVDIPWVIPNAAVGGENALPFFDSYMELSDIEEPALFKLTAMGVDAYELGRRLPQFRAIAGSEVHGATGTLRVANDGRVERELPWAQFTNGTPQPPLRLPTGMTIDNGLSLDDGRAR
ncbi:MULTISPECIES: penicillin-binding protein activator [Halomonadaceae]|uniref:penicillin-binding protein activator n=1 Tax=Halomonadaceae TaxID=28256 RepID=UPI00159897ED|nr:MULTISPECIES: penicillin-binding protein activator [Halomonas]QJQ96415.1 penicillin-binding protein activator [Halomonas sp. PA5]